MGASDSQWLLGALSQVVESLEHCRVSPRSVLRPNIGTLHYLTLPGEDRSVWGVVKRYPDEKEPFYAVFEVEGDEEPHLAQEAHYTAVRRLDAHYLAASAPVLLGMLDRLPESVSRPRKPYSAEDFRTVSLRIPPNPFQGQAWKLRFRHREVSSCIFELEHVYTDITEAAVFLADVAA